MGGELGGVPAALLGPFFAFAAISTAGGVRGAYAYVPLVLVFVLGLGLLGALALRRTPQPNPWLVGPTFAVLLSGQRACSQRACQRR
jgi:hypothetical protein